MVNTLCFKHATVLRSQHVADKLMLTFDTPHPTHPELAGQFPDEGHDMACAYIECSKGYAEEWCKKMGIIVNAIIDVT